MIYAVMGVALSESVYSLFPHPLTEHRHQGPREAESQMEELGATILHVEESCC